MLWVCVHLILWIMISNIELQLGHQNCVLPLKVNYRVPDYPWLNVMKLLQSGLQSLRLSSNPSDAFASNAIGVPQNTADVFAASTPRFHYGNVSPALGVSLNPLSDQLLDVASLYGVSDKMEYDARLHRSAAGQLLTLWHFLNELKGWH